MTAADSTAAAPAVLSTDQQALLLRVASVQPEPSTPQGELDAALAALARIQLGDPTRPPDEFDDFHKLGSARPAEVVLRQRTEVQFELLEPFRYLDAKGRTWVVSASDAGGDPDTDLASVPLWMTWLVPRYGRHTRSALLHDHLQHVRGVSSFEADEVFRESMQDGGVPFVRRWAMWSAVSLRTLINSNKAWLLPVALWVLVYGLGAGLVGWPVAVYQAVHGSWWWVLLELALVASPVVTAAIWKGHYRTGLISGIAMAFVAFPTVFVLWAISAYRFAEVVAGWCGKGDNPVSAKKWAAIVAARASTPSAEANHGR